MLTKSLVDLGLSKNEAEIYETLVQSGESSVSAISQKSKVHRRNVYDCLNRLLEKGLVSETKTGSENQYKAVNPRKLREMLEEKKIILDKIMPSLQDMYSKKPHNEEVYVMKGLEGFKNYMAEILKTKEDVYIVGGAGLWADPRIRNFFEPFLQETARLGINFHTLFDYEVKSEGREILGMLGKDYRFFKKEYSTSTALDVFGDFVVITSKGSDSTIEDTYLTVIVNKGVADAFRVWFKVM